MTTREFQKAALVIAGHGSTRSPDSCLPTLAHAETIRHRGIFAEVATCFWKQEPSFREALQMVKSREIYVVPNFISEGYFTRTVIPREMGLAGRVTVRDGRTINYCDPAGKHPRMTELLLGEARSVAPDVLPEETSLLIVGHGTGLDPNSAEAARLQAALIVRAWGHGAHLSPIRGFPTQRRRGCGEKTVTVSPNGAASNSPGQACEADAALGFPAKNASCPEWAASQNSLKFGARGYAEVVAAFMEEPPLVAEWDAFTSQPNVVVVPFFISDGPHSRRDIPAMLGIPRGAEDAAGREVARGPHELRGRRLYYGAAVGTDPRFAAIILDQARVFSRGISGDIGTGDRSG